VEQVTTVRQEEKYQMIKLVHSGRTLKEAKSMMKAVTVGLSSEYAKSGDLKDLASLEGGLYRIRQTRNDAQQLAKIRFGPRKMNSTKAEHLSKWGTGYRGKIPLDWKRDGNLIRRGPPNKSRKGSSVGKIGRTRVIGAKKVLKDFRSLIKTLRGLQKNGKGDVRDLQKAYRKVRVAASAKG
jgi:hypothetical protein